ncbi:hypothetical protein ASG84_26565 [Rhodococcus sp. Leaf278]|nr:hypothetical protein ASG84_26565 [Rhodococcus sp. Leaf278]
MRYFGQNTANPAAEGAIRADESRINGNADEKNESQGTGIGWAMALEERFRTGEWPDKGTAIKVEWIDPGTSTKAEEADHIQKLNGGTPVYSREGSWDELGWDENRKNPHSEAQRRHSGVLPRGIVGRARVGREPEEPRASLFRGRE